MRNLIFIVLFSFLFISIQAQKIISGKSSPKTFYLVPEYKRGVPPNLFAELDFKDENNNQLLEAEEKSTLTITLINRGGGPAQGLALELSDNIFDENFIFQKKKEIPILNSEESVKIEIPVYTKIDVKSAEHKLRIEVKEHFGYDMDPAFLVLNTLEYQKPELVYAGHEIVEYGEKTMAIKNDGQLQAGEQVLMKVTIQNIGQNIAEGTKFEIKTTDENIYIENGSGVLGDFNIGEYKYFWITISPNKRVSYTDNLPVYLTLSEKKGKGSLVNYQLPIKLGAPPPLTNIVEVKPNIEKLKDQVAYFEYSSSKFKSNIGKLEDIHLVEEAKIKRNNAVAVILGIENYKDLPPAPYASNDAELIKEYFKKRLGIDYVVIFKDDEVSGFIFENVFNPDYGELQKAVVESETEVFVFYSGHGIPDKTGENIYLFPSDGKRASLETQGYNLDKFYTNLLKLKAKSVTVFIDACFSGASRTTEKIKTENLVAMKGGVKVKPKTIYPWMIDPNFSVFTSSSYDETSLGLDETKTGLFTYYVCLGLKGNADENQDGKITTGELDNYVKTNVMETSPKISGVQTPEFYGNKDIILVEY